MCWILSAEPNTLRGKGSEVLSGKGALKRWVCRAPSDPVGRVCPRGACPGAQALCAPHSRRARGRCRSRPQPCCPAAPGWPPACPMRATPVNLLIALVAFVLFSFSCFCISRMTQTSKRRVAASADFPAFPVSGLGDCWGAGSERRGATWEPGWSPGLVLGALQMYPSPPHTLPCPAGG